MMSWLYKSKQLSCMIGCWLHFFDTYPQCVLLHVSCGLLAFTESYFSV